MGKQSEAKKKRRQKRLEFKNMEEKANENLSLLSKSFEMITTKLQETDKEFAEAYSVFENLKEKYLFIDEDKDDVEDFSDEEKKRFDQAFDIVMTKKIGLFGNTMERTLLK